MLSPTCEVPAPSSRHSMLLISLLLVGCVVVDQASKRWAVACLQGAAPQSYLGDCFRLQYALNSGGFLSLGSELSRSARFALFVGFNLLLMSGLGWLMWSSFGTGRGVILGAGLLFAGGVGNLIDRITQDGQVIDFLNLGIGSLRTGIFNVADVAIMVGAVSLWLSRAATIKPPIPTVSENDCT